MYIELDEMSDIAQLDFKFSVKSFGQDSLQIQLEFDETKMISTNVEPDYLVVEMKDFQDM